MAAFGNFCTKSIGDKFQFKYQRVKSNVTFVMSILKVEYLVPLFFLTSYFLATKIEVCLQYFMDKFFQKQP